MHPFDLFESVRMLFSCLFAIPNFQHVIDLKPVVLRHDDGILNDLFQLPYVARPGIGIQSIMNELSHRATVITGSNCLLGLNIVRYIVFSGSFEIFW